MLHARGAVLLFVDADGASRFADLAALEKHMARLLESTEHGLVIGSRAHMVNTPAVVQRSRLRNLLMRCFHLYLRLLGVHAVQDTQCGFKLFSRASARLLFGNLHTVHALALLPCCSAQLAHRQGGFLTSSCSFWLNNSASQSLRCPLRGMRCLVAR